ncbi:MAG: hypothetical protein EOO19_04835 [Chryseobacterium sp.]|nr:MAG: hypothetical protein EOO19_04835 [Chryseobacterium sp.]
MDYSSIIGFSKDHRTETFVMYVQMDIKTYLSFVGDKFDEFSIQRKKESHKGYARLKNDIKDGALLPPITLALKPELVKKYIPFLRAEPQNVDQLNGIFQVSESVYILDGLQRTHIMKDLSEEGYDFKQNQKLLLEFWFEEDMGNLIYRLIVLNSGQKPMSMRHQVELLFLTMQDKLKKDIPGLIMYNERESKARDNASMFPFDRIVTGYQSFLNQSPEINKGKLISDKLDTGKVITDVDMVILEGYNEYTAYLTKYLAIDVQSYRVYEKFSSFSGAKNWLADENVVNSFFAAIGILADEPVFKKRIDLALLNLTELLTNSKIGDDPFALKDYDLIRQGFNPKQFNIGFISRKTIMNCFLEYFKGEGLLSFKKCWSLAKTS